MFELNYVFALRLCTYFTSLSTWVNSQLSDEHAW